jgi:hypothetical protein
MRDDENDVDRGLYMTTLVVFASLGFAFGYVVKGWLL